MTPRRITARPTGQQVAIYVRISKDRAGQGLGVQRQETACRELCQANGWTVAEVYSDNDVSAANRKKVRPEFTRMLADAEAGRIDGIVSWAWDRLCRRIVDLEKILDLAEDKPGFAVGAVTGDLNISTPTGRTLARVVTSIAAGEIEVMRARIREQQKQSADAGRPKGGGRRPYGYTADRRHVVPEEAEILREAAGRLLAGESVRSIVGDLNARGVTSATGRTWSSTVLREVVTKPQVAGLLVHQGEIHRDGTWPAILDRATWEALTALFGDPARKMAAGHGARRHLLTRIARCGLCGAGMRISTGPGGTPRYSCDGCGRLNRNQMHLDEFVIGNVIELLRALPRVNADGGPDPRLGEIGMQLAALKATRTGLVRDFATLGLSEADLRDALAANTAAREALEAEREVRSRSLVLDETLVGITRDEWDALPLSRRKAVVERLVTVTLLPARKGPGFDVDGVLVRPATTPG